MINRTQIKQMTNDSSYKKGMDLFRGNKLMEFEVVEDEDTDYIDAVVEGSGENDYQVTLEYDTEFDDLLDIQCQCPAFFKYDGLCKHCIAVLLRYQEVKASRQMIRECTEKKAQSLTSLQSMKGLNGMKKKVLQTDPLMKQMLTKRRERDVLPYLESETYGKVRLDPILTVTNQEITLEFKIGISRMYVLQDVFRFAQLFQIQGEYEYGMKLKLIHVLEMFDEESRALIEFVLNWVYYHIELYAAPYQLYAPTLKTLPLEGIYLELFLDAVGSREFKANVKGRGEQLWSVTEEKLIRTLKITGDSEGILLELNSVVGIQGVLKHTYFDNQKIYRVPKAEMDSFSDFSSAIAQSRDGKVFIHKEDVPLFCMDYLPKLEQYYVCEEVSFNRKDYEIPHVEFEIYLDAPQRDIITCRLVAIYGDQKFDVYDKSSDLQRRDLRTEMETGKIISEYCNAFDDVGKMMVAAKDEEKQYELLTEGIPRFQQLGQVYISDALKKINIIRPVKMSVGVSLSGNLLELSMTADGMDRAQLLEILSKYNRKKKFYRLRDGDFITVDNEMLQALVELKERLSLTDSQLKKKTLMLPRYQALYLDEELRNRQGLFVTKDNDYRELIKDMKMAASTDFTVPESLEDILREYQKKGFSWIKALKYNGFGGILADDMGLGKTLQVIAFVVSEFEETKAGDNCRILIISPASLVFNWGSELQKFAPQLPVKMVIGTAAERQAMIVNSSEREILLTSYDLLKRDIDCYEDIEFACQIADEAQYIKNHQTQAANAVKTVRAGFRLALTGTPVENRLSELWSIFDYLMPGFLYSYPRFKEELEVPIVQHQNGEAAVRLQKMIRPFVLRRLKKDVLADLPEKLEECRYTRLEGEQQKLYDAHVQRMKMMLSKQSEEEFKTSKIQILAELTKLRQICCNPALIFDKYKAESVKTSLCLELIQSAVNGGHKILLFSQFTSMLEKLQEQLEELNISFYVLTGDVSKVKRAKLVEKFNEDDTSVFCISLKAGGTGLNLTAADIVIHYDPWWNLAVQNQATDRAHRIGQENVVTVYKLIVKGTIEENIMKLQEKKRELADQILGGQGLDSGSFSREELLELL